MDAKEILAMAQEDAMTLNDILNWLKDFKKPTDVVCTRGEMITRSCLVATYLNNRYKSMIPTGFHFSQGIDDTAVYEDGVGKSVAMFNTPTEIRELIHVADGDAVYHKPGDFMTKQQAMKYVMIARQNLINAANQ